MLTSSQVRVCLEKLNEQDAKYRQEARKEANYDDRMRAKEEEEE
jgi:hypothetical protein